MRRGIVCLALLIGLVGAAPAYSAIEVAITSPAGGAHSLSGVVPVLVTASADNGIYAVQLNVDGAAYGAPDTEQVGQYRYEIDWNTSGLPAGDHTLTVTAYDWSLPSRLPDHQPRHATAVDVRQGAGRADGVAYERRRSVHRLVHGRR